MFDCIKINSAKIEMRGLKVPFVERVGRLLRKLVTLSHTFPAGFIKLKKSKNPFGCAPQHFPSIPVGSTERSCF